MRQGKGEGVQQDITLTCWLYITEGEVLFRSGVGEGDTCLHCVILIYAQQIGIIYNVELFMCILFAFFHFFEKH